VAAPCPSVPRPRLERLEDRLAPATLPAGFSESVVAGSLTEPTAMDFSPDGRLFVAEQPGTLVVFQNGALDQANFFCDTPLTVNFLGERGLLGLAFDPQFATNRFVYVYYTATTPTVHNRISRFTANAAGDLALPGSEVVLRDLPTLGPAFHNGGGLHFGPDDKLYAGVGENGTPSNSQSLATPLGKILRINPDGTVPADNPFVGVAGADPDVWALGLRNPFTFGFQPGTGRMFINDVGAASFEEIDQGQPGGNYGWPDTEGPTNDPRFITLFFSYDHTVGGAIVGGTFYNPPVLQFPGNFTGTYFFADFDVGFIHRIDPSTKVVSDFATGISFPVDLKVDAAGNLYYLARGTGQSTGQVVRIQFTPAADAIGAFDPATANWYLRNSTGPGAPDAGQFQYGGAGWAAVVGDWDGNGTQTAGAVDPLGDTNPNELVWYLRNSNSAGAPDITPFNYGGRGWVPLAADWFHTGQQGIGAFDPATATWYLRGSASAGAADVGIFQYGAADWKPVVGDWTGTGRPGIGVFDPSTATWYLRNSLSAGAPDFVFQYGAAGWLPVVGDWNGDGRTDLGVVDPGTGTWYLKLDVGAGGPDAGLFQFGGPWQPLAGQFNGPAMALRAAGTPDGAAGAPLSEADLRAAVARALGLVSAAGAGPQLLGSLASAQYTVGALPPGLLGLTYPATHRVVLDEAAAGFGWSLDGGPGSAGHMDLLSAVLHEMGHLAGLSDVDAQADPTSLLAGTLAPGQSRVGAIDALFAGLH
jgi:glucose/arabinose dehydrogenase